jgi:nucleoside-diphosphate-sugar epimerase
MIALVTGAAGFIGSHLCEHLLAAGDEVKAVDAFTDYYPRAEKERNIATLVRCEGFSFVEGDLTEMPLAPLLVDVDVVYHLAAQPGVRSSWGAEFDLYVRDNVLATQRLLEECRSRSLRKLVYASSSSVYGDAPSYPTSESSATKPVSPYGVTKLAAEHLCRVYQVAYSVPSAALRLFSVYGPRQRPDMALARLVKCAVHGGTFELYGNGEQTRDWTFVADVVTAMRKAAVSDWTGVANIGGGVRVSMKDVLAAIWHMCGEFEVMGVPRGLGDVRDTGADTGLARNAFGYGPRTSLGNGLQAMIEWESARMRTEVLA